MATFVKYEQSVDRVDCKKPMITFLKSEQSVDHVQCQKPMVTAQRPVSIVVMIVTN
jgi:hypothetical protein